MAKRAAVPTLLSEEAWWRKAVLALRDEKKGKGINPVYTGANEAFRKYYGGADPVACTKRLEEAGKLVIRGGKKAGKGGKETGYVLIYLPEDATQANGADAALAKMGLQ